MVEAKTTMLQEGAYDEPNLRWEVEGMIYRGHVLYPWRDLPRQFDRSSAIYKKFSDGSMTGKWLTIFKAVIQNPGLKWVSMNGGYIKAHQHSVGAAGNNCEVIDISRADYTSKVQLAVNSFGLPVGFKITRGQVQVTSKVPD